MSTVVETKCDRCGERAEPFVNRHKVTIETPRRTSNTPWRESFDLCSGCVSYLREWKREGAGSDG